MALTSDIHAQMPSKLCQNWPRLFAIKYCCMWWCTSVVFGRCCNNRQGSGGAAETVVNKPR